MSARYYVHLQKKSMRIFGVIFLLTIPFQVICQNLSLSQNQLNFGNTYENSPDSILLTITNSASSATTVGSVRFYPVYGTNPFSVSDSNFTIAAGANKSIWVKFSPIHNVNHNVEMVIVNNSHRGNVTVDLRGQGKYSKSYYSHTENLEEQQLKDTLQAITGRGYTQLGYNTARDKMFMNIDNKKTNGQGAASNTLECVYTGRNAVGYTNRSNCQSNYNFNTEHTYPQNYFGSVEPMLSDLFHLYPTDNTANSVRGSFRFGVVTGTPTWTDGGSKFAGVFFEPRDQHKGEVARAMFYFVVRYQNYQGFLTTQEATLRDWLHNFPTTTIEKKRNTDINAFQHNYNPFIDYPQFVDRITSISNTSVAAVNKVIDATDSIIDYGMVPSGVTTTYNYVIVNQGNAAVNFTNFSLTNPAVLSFGSGTGSNTTLQPGEALQLKLQLNPSNSDSLFEYLSFNSDAAGAGTIQIPLFANFHQLPLSSATPLVQEVEFLVKPNPNNGIFELNYSLNLGERATLQLHDMLGKSIFTQVLDGGAQHLELNLQSIPQGVYTWTLVGERSMKQKKMVVVK